MTYFDISDILKMLFTCKVTPSLVKRKQSYSCFCIFLEFMLVPVLNAPVCCKESLLRCVSIMSTSTICNKYYATMTTLWTSDAIHRLKKTSQHNDIETCKDNASCPMSEKS